MSRRQVTRICVEGWYYLFVVLFIFGGAVLGEVNLLVMLAGLTIAPLLVNWRLTQLMMRRLQLRRTVPPRVCAGDTLTMTVVGLNQRRRLASWTVVVEDAVEREGDAADVAQRVRILLPRVPTQGSCAASYRVQLTRRGRYRFGPLDAYTRFPFGLVRSGLLLPERPALLVTPRRGRLTQRWLQIVDARLQGSHSAGRFQGKLEGDFYGLREWRPGDSQRWIHWRTSARLGELTVRQFEQQRKRDVILVLDLWQPDSPTEQDLLQTEIAISFLATAVTDLAQRLHSHIVISVSGRETRYWAGPASTLIAHEVVDHLAEAAPGDGRQIGRVLEHVRTLGRARARSVVISTREAPVLTGADERNAGTPARGPRRAPGHVTWINCGSESLRQYFQWPGGLPAPLDGGAPRHAGRRDRMPRADEGRGS